MNTLSIKPGVPSDECVTRGGPAQSREVNVAHTLLLDSALIYEGLRHLSRFGLVLAVCMLAACGGSGGSSSSGDDPTGEITVDGTFDASGPMGGPFVGSGGPILIENTTEVAFDYEIEIDQPWLVLDVPMVGTVDAGATLTVNPSIDAAFVPSVVGQHVAHVAVMGLPEETNVGTVDVDLDVTEPPPPPPPPPSGSAMTTANHTSGVAPLGVFFDAVDTTSPVWQSGVVQPSGAKYASLQYEWDFGDPNSGNWTTTGNSRNLASGYTTAHVFENPGTYTVSLTVTDPATGNTSTYVQDITVTAFSGTTYYVDAVSGNDQNDGLTTGTAWKSVAKAFASGVGTNRSVLFKRGQTHASTGPTGIFAAGPGILGAYGTGAKPIITITDAAGPIALYNSNWRIMDLSLVGLPGVVEATGVDFFGDGARNDNTMLRLECTGFRVAIGWTHGAEWNDPHSGNIIADCDAHDNLSNGMYIGGQRLAVIGTRIENVRDSHVLRLWQVHKGVVSNNVLRNPGATRHAIKLHGPANGENALMTKFVTINDNLIRGTAAATAIGPQNANYDERVTQVVFERNVSDGAPGKGADVEVFARNVTVRNNVFIMTGSDTYSHGVIIEQRGIEPPPQDIDVYNNTMYRADNGASFFTMVQVSSAASNVNVRNNIGSAPQISNKHVVYGSCTNLVVSNNQLTDTPGWLDAAAGDFHLTAGSAAVDAGVSLLEVWEDLERKARTSESAPDLGAFER
jgi:hypothetical protein